jgi:hypothetical protein
MKLNRRSGKPNPSFSKDARLKFDELSPDGVRIIVDWDAFVIGASLFVPAIDVVELIDQMRLIASNKKWDIEYRFRVENGKLGVRFWRTL